VLRRLFGPKRDEETGEMRKLHHEEIMICTAHPIFCSDDQIEKSQMGGACSTLWGEVRCICGFGRET
jgi:hypothetical protein